MKQTLKIELKKIDEDNGDYKDKEKVVCVFITRIVRITGRVLLIS